MGTLIWAGPGIPGEPPGCPVKLDTPILPLLLQREMKQTMQASSAVKHLMLRPSLTRFSCRLVRDMYEISHDS